MATPNKQRRKASESGGAAQGRDFSVLGRGANESLRCSDQAKRPAASRGGEAPGTSRNLRFARLVYMRAGINRMLSFRMGEHRSWEKFAILILIEPGTFDVEEAKACEPGSARA